MAKKKKAKSKKPVNFKPVLTVYAEENLTTNRRIKKTDQEMFFEIKNIIPVKTLAKKLKLKERTLRSYYRSLAGSELKKSDRRAPDKLLKKVSKIINSFNSKLPRKEKIKVNKHVVINVDENTRITFDELLPKAKRKKIQGEINSLGVKYAFMFVRLSIRYTHKHGEIFYKHETIKSNFKNVVEIFTQAQDYINSLLAPYIKKAEIISMSYQVIKKEKIKSDDYDPYHLYK